MDFYSGVVRRPVYENSRLAGTGRVADDLYLIAHHESSGRPYLSPRCAGIGVAGGLLAELMAAEKPVITLDGGRVAPLYRGYARPDEPVTGHVLGLIMAESPPRPAGDWLLFLARTAAANVAGRLERCGYLTRPESRIPGRVKRPVPGEQEWATCALLRAHAALSASRPLTPYLAVLAGLATACGLGFRFSNLTMPPLRSVEEATWILPPVLRELIVCVQVSADSTVLSARK
jgi:hypothetical protein